MQVLYNSGQTIKLWIVVICFETKMLPWCIWSVWSADQLISIREALLSKRLRRSDALPHCGHTAHNHVVDSCSSSTIQRVNRRLSSSDWSTDLTAWRTVQNMECRDREMNSLHPLRTRGISLNSDTPMHDFQPAANQTERRSMGWNLSAHVIPNSSSHSCQVTVNSCQGKHPESPEELTVVLKYVQRQKWKTEEEEEENPPFAKYNKLRSVATFYKQGENVKLTSELWNFLFKFKEWAGLIIFLWGGGGPVRRFNGIHP